MRPSTNIHRGSAIGAGHCCTEQSWRTAHLCATALEAGTYLMRPNVSASALFALLSSLTISILLSQNHAIADAHRALRVFDVHLCADALPERLHVRLPAGYEFGFEPHSIENLSPSVPYTTGLPRDTSAPKGCRSNPVSMNGLHLYWTATMSSSQAPGLKPRWRVHNLIIRAQKNEGVEHARFGSQIRRLEEFGKLGILRKQLNADVRMISERLEAIFLPNTIDELGERDGIICLAATPGSYEEFSNKQYIARCSGALRRGGGKNCRANYLLSCNLNVHCQFLTGIVKEKEAILLDAEMRSFLRKRAHNPALLDPERPCSG